MWKDCTFNVATKCVSEWFNFFCMRFLAHQRLKRACVPTRRRRTVLYTIHVFLICSFWVLPFFVVAGALKGIFCCKCNDGKGQIGACKLSFDSSFKNHIIKYSYSVICFDGSCALHWTNRFSLFIVRFCYVEMKIVVLSLWNFVIE